MELHKRHTTSPQTDTGHFILHQNLSQQQLPFSFQAVAKAWLPVPHTWT
jgi:hypothetical protein